LRGQQRYLNPQKPEMNPGHQLSTDIAPYPIRYKNP
jgi:hypothetical protein